MDVSFLDAGRRRHDLARCAEATLKAIAINEGLLYGVKRLTVGQPLDSCNLVILRTGSQRQTR